MLGTSSLRRLAAGLSTLAVLGVLVPGPLAGTGHGATLTVVPDCDGGQAGVATDDTGRRVTFRVCPLPGGGFESRITGRDGTALSGVRYVPGGEGAIEVGGVVLSDRDYAPGELDRVRRVLASPDGPLAGRLPALLVREGWAEDSLVVRALAAHGPVFEDRGDHGGEGLHPRGWGCTDPATGCRGCCGPGCWGCTGICTPECLAHDECVERHGHLSPRCLLRLSVAIDSYLECLKCPEECKDGPADCCRGEGPACVEIP